MRITNKIIQNNSLGNINNNKVLQDKLSTQIATEKKISRPSDDPIVALRSLRLRTSVNQTDQYLKKNVSDAKSWLTVTEDAIDTLSSIITDIRNQYVKGTNDPLKVSDRNIIKEDLKALQQEVYNTGNADFAGRSVFTGYRTDSSLTFQANDKVNYEITQKFYMIDPQKGETDATFADTISHVTTDDLRAATSVEQNIEQNDITRLRLAYSNCSDTDITLECDGTTYTTTKMSVSANPYDYVINNPSEIVYVYETGEVLVGKSSALLTETDEISVKFSKEEWLKGDLRPEHYFECTNKDTGVDYNVSSATGEIEYNIGVNQTIRINTLASECFNHDIARDIDDLINTIEEVENVEQIISELEAELAALPEADTAGRALVQTKIDAAKKAQTFYNDKLHNAFASGITKADGYLNRDSVALTDCGTRSKRLDLIENRLDTQLSTLKELKSENEDIDLAEAAIQLASAEQAYSASLMATSKIMKESLLNYI